MHAALHGRIRPAISLDEALDLVEVLDVAASHQAAKQRNLADAADNARRERAKNQGRTPR